MIKWLWAQVFGCNHVEPHEVKEALDIKAWLRDDNPDNWEYEKVRCVLCDSAISFRIVHKGGKSEHDQKEEARTYAAKNQAQ